MKPTAVRPTLPPVSLVLLAIGSVQIGSALAKSLFTELGPSGMTFLRVVLAAIILGLLWRPQWRPETRQSFRTVLVYGAVLALMNFLFYQAIARIPVGIAVALEFTGPLGLSVTKSRRWLEAVWVAIAAVGVILLAPIGGFELNWLGIALALAAGLCWASYILLAARVGQLLPGVEGLTWAMLFGAILLLPVGLQPALSALQRPQLFLIASGVALLSSVLPYALELSALRHMPVQLFGVLMSLEPMVAAVAGFVVLGETLTLRAVIAIALISLAAAGASRYRTTPA
ncbi:MAG: EamA family transporter [Leptolyngbya sp. SIO4C1]|nr:EamA family transporter [Leptolyngbya sp. SIO4C1]